MRTFLKRIALFQAFFLLLAVVLTLMLGERHPRLFAWSIAVFVVLGLIAVVLLIRKSKALGDVAGHRIVAIIIGRVMVAFFAFALVYGLLSFRNDFSLPVLVGAAMNILITVSILRIIHRLEKRVRGEQPQR